MDRMPRAAHRNQMRAARIEQANARVLGSEVRHRALDHGLQQILERPPALDLEREVDERLQIARHGARRIAPRAQPSGGHWYAVSMAPVATKLSHAVPHSSMVSN